MPGHVAAIASLIMALHAPNHHAIRTHFSQARAEPLMLAAAADYWHQLPACGEPTLVRVTVLPAAVQPDSWAYATPGDPTCSIYIVAQDWTPATEHEFFGAECRIIAHEYSHLLGYPDEDAPYTLLDHVIWASVPDEYCDGAAQFVGA